MSVLFILFISIIFDKSISPEMLKIIKMVF